MRLICSSPQEAEPVKQDFLIACPLLFNAFRARSQKGIEVSKAGRSQLQLQIAMIQKTSP